MLRFCMQNKTLISEVLPPSGDTTSKYKVTCSIAAQALNMRKYKAVRSIFNTIKALLSLHFSQCANGNAHFKKR